MGLGISSLLVAALLGSGAFMQPAVLGNQQLVVSSSKRRHMASMFDEFRIYGGAFSYPKRLGWSNRMVQRMATKRRNQKRNKQAHKGK
mgnify:CR=1 FL=1